MIIPPYLKQGDRIRIVSPAGRVSEEKVMPGIELLKKDGFEVFLGKHVFSEYFQFAGNDDERAEDFQEAIDDKQTKAIICARGGYGSVRIIEKVNFTSLVESPKWLVGFSDITVLHTLLSKMGIASVHALMSGSYLDGDKSSECFLDLMKTLKGNLTSHEIESHPQNRLGTCEGILTGGNLSLIASLQGTPYEIDTDGKILFLEDLSEHSYHIDRMMRNLLLSGKLEKLAGLIVGGFTNMKDDESVFGRSVEGIIRDVVASYNYPVCFNIPAGHMKSNYPLVFGSRYSLKVEGKCSLSSVR